MTSFKNFRNRVKDPRGDVGSAGPPNGHGAPYTATEMGPEHLAILRQLEAEGEPLTLAEEIAELTDRGQLDEAAAKLDTFNTQGETHIAELQRMTMPQLLAEDPDPLGPEPQRWRRDKPTEPQGKGRDRWSRLR